MTAGELNSHIEDGTIDEVIRVAEARQCKVLSRIADDICARQGVRLVLLAGGSSSGKTTTASRICTQLMVDDRAAVRLSTDDYFVGDEDTPRNPDGSLDYEHIECVDIAALTADITALIRGDSILRRRFDFVNHQPMHPGDWFLLPPGGVLVLEGIHALNPRLTELIDDAVKYRIYISPQPSVELFLDLRPSAEDARLLRRLVRDNQFRKVSPANTILRWPSVIAGEKKWIEPFRGNADATFDSYLVYEMPVLKNYVGGLLERARKELGDTQQIVNLRRMLSVVMPVDPTMVPGDSILRETIGGSQLEY
ncbi:MAG: nucleoside kinase [Kiritimatiellae bacterium]|nr:nucleoside kinase [Kiritimatiellia bacterium]